MDDPSGENLMLNSTRDFIVDSASLLILINGEKVNLAESYRNILLEWTQLSFKCYITKNENILYGNCFDTIDKRFDDQSHPDVAAIWFHIFDGDETDYLYIKWTEYGKPKSDFLGLEFTFHQE